MTRDAAYNVHAGGEPRRKPPRAFERRTRNASLTAWNSPDQICAAGRRPGSIAARSSFLMIHIFTLLLSQRAAALRLLNGASDGIPQRGDASSLCPTDSTCSSYSLTNRATRQESLNERGNFALHTEAPSVPESRPSAPWEMYFERSAFWNTSSKSKIPTTDAPIPPTVSQPDKLSEPVHLLGVESDGGSFVAAEGKQRARLDYSNFGQPRGEQWLCRISGHMGACSSQERDGRGPDWYCGSNYCCAGTCTEKGCGYWCHHNFSARCVSTDSRYSGPLCSCEHKGVLCSSQASCHTVDLDRGGTYCTCAQDFLGDGKTCNRNPCHSNPCSPGSCSARGSQYVCDCPSSTHEVQGSDAQLCVKKKNACLTDPCGSPDIVETCLNFQTEYECICKDGYISEEGFCEKMNWCKGDPCGPRIAVQDCISVDLGYKCECRNGYLLRKDPRGLEYCAKDYCADEPCGPKEFVQSCVNLGGDRKDSNTDTASRYSCVCSNVAELVVDQGTQKEKCVRIDPCRGDPCGPREAFSQCLVDGLSYRCVCKRGYTAVRTGVNREMKCVPGDPCSSKPCGPEEFVDNCTASGQTYTCQCSNKGFLSLEADDTQFCRSKELCEENCGPSTGLKRCTPNDSGYDCICKPGFSMTFTEGQRSCETQDPCAVAPCGTVKAVAECRPEGHGYSCLCNRGYELRFRPDETQLCAESQSCVGSPCGAVETVQQCIPGKYTYTCQCRTPYVVREVGGRQRCALPVSEEDGKPKPDTGVQGKEESESHTAVLVAGVAVGGLLLVGAAYAGIRYARKSGDQQQGDSWEEGEVSPGAHPAGAVAGSTGDVGMIRYA